MASKYEISNDIYNHVEPDDINLTDDQPRNPYEWVTSRDRRKKKTNEYTLPSKSGFETLNRFHNLQFHNNRECFDQAEVSDHESEEDVDSRQQVHQALVHRDSKNIYTKNKRPSIVIQKFPERNVGFERPPRPVAKSYEEAVKPLRPGANTYGEAVKDGKRVIVFSTSMTKGIKVRKLNEILSIGSARFRRFHGGKAKHVFNYVDTHLEDEKPEVVLIQVGGNDLPTRKDYPSSVKEIAEIIIETGKKCLRYGTVKDVLISSVITRKSFYMDN